MISKSNAKDTGCIVSLHTATEKHGWRGFFLWTLKIPGEMKSKDYPKCAGRSGVGVGGWVEGETRCIMGYVQMAK